MLNEIENYILTEIEKQFENCEINLITIENKDIIIESNQLIIVNKYFSTIRINNAMTMDIQYSTLKKIIELTETFIKQ